MTPFVLLGTPSLTHSDPLSLLFTRLPPPRQWRYTAHSPWTDPNDCVGASARLDYHQTASGAAAAVVATAGNWRQRTREGVGARG